MKRYLAVSLGLAVFLCADLAAQAASRRLLSLDDLASFRGVADPRVSPDGKWVAYTVESVDAATDEKRSTLSFGPASCAIVCSGTSTGSPDIYNPASVTAVTPKPPVPRGQ